MNSLVTALFQRAARKSRRWAGVKRPVGRGADSFLGGTLVARTLVFVSAVLEQLGQINTCTTVAASARKERDQAISIAHFGQCGGSRCSSDFLSRSTMRLPFLVRESPRLERFSKPNSSGE